MKVNYLTKRSFIKIHLLKNQIYTPFSLYNNGLDNTILELKKVLKLIFVYNKHNKKILFLGFPFKKVLHNQISHSFKTKNYYKKEILAKDNFLKKKYDLVVLNYTCKQDNIYVQNVKKLNIPLIIFGKELNYPNKNYCVRGHFKRKKIKSLCFFLIFSILTKKIFKL